MSPYSALQNQQSEVEKVFTSIVFAGLLLNIYLQLTMAIIIKVSYCNKLYIFIQYYSGRACDASARMGHSTGTILRS